MTDTLAPKAIIGVMTPAMNTVVQPELDALRPLGVTNQLQRFRLGGERISDDLFDEADKLMDCNPRVLAIGLTTDAGPGGVDRLAAVCAELQERVGIPVCNASIATQKGLHLLRVKRVAVLTPFDDAVNAVVRDNIEAGGFDVVATAGCEAPSLAAICATPLARIRELVRELARSDCEAIAQVGAELPLVGLVDELERETGKPVVACNAALYWQALRAAGNNDPVPRHGRLLYEG